MTHLLCVAETPWSYWARQVPAREREVAKPKGTGVHKEGALIPALLPAASGHLNSTSLTSRVLWKRMEKAGSGRSCAGALSLAFISFSVKTNKVLLPKDVIRIGGY